MLVSIATQTSAICNLDVEVTFAAPDERSHGSATLRIPRTSSAWDAAVLDPRGGFYTVIHSPLGIFRGISEPPVNTARGAEIAVVSLTRWAEIRYVRSTHQFLMAPAGMIAREAVREAFLGVLPLSLGDFLMAPPYVPEYTFSGQSVASVMNELMELTGHVWTISEGGSVNWEYRSGRHHPEWLVDDGSLFSDISRGSLSDIVAEYIEVDDAGREFRASDSAAPVWWPRQVIEEIT